MSVFEIVTIKGRLSGCLSRSGCGNLRLLRTRSALIVLPPESNRGLTDLSLIHDINFRFIRSTQYSPEAIYDQNPHFLTYLRHLLCLTKPNPISKLITSCG